MKRAIILLVALLGMVTALGLVGLATADAQMLKYVDDQGATHYVDSAEKIPERYRGEAITPRNLPPATQTDAGVSERTLQEWRRAKALQEAKKKREQANQEFQDIAIDCAGGLEIIQKPGRRVTVLGTNRQIFDFDRCMNDRGQTLELGR